MDLAFLKIPLYLRPPPPNEENGLRIRSVCGWELLGHYSDLLFYVIDA